MTITTTIDLLCHGEIEGGGIFCGLSDPQVSDTGWTQMETSLGDSHWDGIISSPLLRCAEFAESLAAEVGELVLDENFKDISFGQWEGLSPEQIIERDAALLKQWWKSPTIATPPAGEDFYDFRSRVLRAWKELTEDYENQNVLLITHAMVIRVILMQVLGMHEENLFRLDVGNASISRITIHQDETGSWITLSSHG